MIVLSSFLFDVFVEFFAYGMVVLFVFSCKTLIVMVNYLFDVFVEFGANRSCLQGGNLREF